MSEEKKWRAFWYHAAKIASFQRNLISCLVPISEGPGEEWLSKGYSYGINYSSRNIPDFVNGSPSERAFFHLGAISPDYNNDEFCLDIKGIHVNRDSLILPARDPRLIWAVHYTMSLKQFRSEGVPLGDRLPQELVDLVIDPLEIVVPVSIQQMKINHKK